MMENMIDTKVKNCFWVIGNTNLIRWNLTNIKNMVQCWKGDLNAWFFKRSYQNNW
jgi:hypothetical protein